MALTHPSAAGFAPFGDHLASLGLSLVRGTATTLQVNVGLVCDRTCRHCHLEAGPGRPEVMSAETMAQVVACARRVPFETLDLTGGAPELVPGIEELLEALAPLSPRLLWRANLTALAGRPALVARLARLGVAVVASFPSTSARQTEAQRGEGAWEASLEMLRRLNRVGYGRPGTGLELDLVSNPAGAFLPPAQAGAAERFRRDLARRWGIQFNHLYTFTNVPLGRFRTWLEASGNLDGYLQALAEAFNPGTLSGLMCQTLVSVDWAGWLHDCDFHLARGIGLGGRRCHVTELSQAPTPGSPIATGDHCYACTAGAGFT